MHCVGAKAIDQCVKCLIRDTSDGALGLGLRSTPGLDVAEAHLFRATQAPAVATPLLVQTLCLVSQDLAQTSHSQFPRSLVGFIGWVGEDAVHQLYSLQGLHFERVYCVWITMLRLKTYKKSE